MLNCGKLSASLLQLLCKTKNVYFAVYSNVFIGIAGQPFLVSKCPPMSITWRIIITIIASTVKK